MHKRNIERKHLSRTANMESLSAPVLKTLKTIIEMHEHENFGSLYCFFKRTKKN